MIQEIAPHKFDLTYGHPKAQDEDFVLFIKKSKTLLRKTAEENHEIPKFSDFPEDKEALKENAYYLFAIDGNHYYYVTEMPEHVSDAYELCPTAAYRKMHPMYQAFAGITATQIHRFKESRKYCGCCGHLMENSKTERALVCPECGQTEYPKISPAVIVAISDGDRLREVMEEVGLKVKNIRYYKSQPWAFSDTEMIGFFAELDGPDKIKLQEDELSEAGWYHRDEIPDETMMNSIGSELKMVFKYGSLEKFYEATGYHDEN